MSAHLVLYDAAGAFLALLPDVEQAACQEELNGAGSWSASYPPDGVNADVLLAQDDAQVAFVLDGREVYRGLWEDDGDDEADPDDLVKLAGRGLLAILHRAVVYPPGGVGSVPAEVAFDAATPGAMLDQLLTAAQTRGALPGITWTFTGAADSAGVAWPDTWSVTYAAGVAYDDVLDSMVGFGWLDVRMVGTELQVFVPDTELGRDRPDQLLHIGREVRQLERMRSRRELASHVLVLGSEGANAERENATTAAQYGRREASLSQGNTTEAGTMARLGDAELAKLSRPKHGRTVVYDLDARDANQPTPLPWTDYRVGDYIRLAHVRQADGTLEPLRVRTIAASFTADGIVEPSVELSDVFLEATLQLQRRIQGITNGTSYSGGGADGTAPPDGGTVEEDTKTPSAPAAPNISADAYQVEGITRAVATISWPQVTTNTDGTPYDDHGHYVVEWSVTGGTGRGSRNTSGTYVDVPDLPPGQTITATVWAQDSNGNRSTASGSSSLVLPGDTTAPPTPSTPAVEGRAGIVRVSWDGLGSAGEAMPADFAHVEVHASTAGTAFTPDATTHVDTLSGAGTSVQPAAVDTTLAIKLVAVDRIGNRSAPSAAASATSRSLVASELAAGAVLREKLAASAVWQDQLAADAVVTNHLTTGAVVTDTLAAGAVTVDRLRAGVLNVGNLEAGTLAADVTVASRIATALTGSRVELNSSGLRAYSGSTETVAIRNDGSASFTGNVNAQSGTFSGTITVSGTLSGGTIQGATFRTAASGTRVEMGPNTYFDSSAATNYYDPQGRRGASLRAVNNSALLTSGYANLGFSTLHLDPYGTVSFECLDYYGGGGVRFKVQPWGSELVTGGVFALNNDGVVRFRGSGDGNHQIKYEGTRDGPRLTGYGGVDLWVHGYWNGGPTAYANNAGEWRVATRVYAGGYQLSSKADTKRGARRRQDAGLGKLRALQAVSYRRAEARDDDGREHLGFVAEEVAEVFPEGAAYDSETGELYGVDVFAFVTALTTSVQELDARLDQLEAARP